MAISTPMLVTFCVYIFGMILIGFIAWRSTKNFDDYILGGRSLGPFVTALSAGASDMSGWLLMGLPGEKLDLIIADGRNCLIHPLISFTWKL
jgi:sodium/proline symporter